MIAFVAGFICGLVASALAALALAAFLQPPPDLDCPPGPGRRP